MRKWFIIGIIVIIVLISIGFSVNYTQDDSVCKGTAQCITETVSQVIDGDTIHANPYKIRLSLTNTPERGEEGFTEATAFTKNLCPVGSTILVDQDDLQHYDSYGRLLGKVICDGKNLNSELLENDHAWILTQYCSTSEFSDEAWAKKFGR